MTQTNNLGSCASLQKHQFKKYGSSQQINYKNSFYNIQLNHFTAGGTADQICYDGSGGNIQINIGAVGKQVTGSGYSYNLQYNVIRCSTGQRNQVKYNNGNVWIQKCVEHVEYADLNHESLALKFRIWFISRCTNTDHIEVGKGDILYQACYNFEKPVQTSINTDAYG